MKKIDPKAMEIIEPKATVRNMTHFMSEDYTIPLLLSEFIDNSIASWENTVSKDISGLSIKITFYKTETQYGENTRTKYSIKILDNAGGMTEEVAKKSTEMYDKQDKEENDLNQHGIGMKSACSWFGKDYEFYTKSKYEEKTNIIIWKSSDKKPNDRLAYLFGKKEKDYNEIPTETGTAIFIESVREDAFILSNSNYSNMSKFIKTFLGWKYKYYLEKGLEIIIKYEYSGDANYIETEDNILNIKPFQIDFWKKEDFLKNLEKKNKNNPNFNIKEIEEELISRIKEIMNKTTPGSEKWEICEKILSNKEVKINVKRDFNLGKMKTLEITNLGIISPDNKYKTKYSLKNICGLSTFHHERGIDIGPVDDKAFTGKIPKPFNFSYDGSTKNLSKSTALRLTGEAHFSGVKTELNKTTILMEPSVKENFREILGDIWKVFEDVLDVIVDIETNAKSNKSLTIKKAEEVFGSTLTKLNQIKITEDNEKKDYSDYVKKTDDGLYKYYYNSIEIGINKYNFSLTENDEIYEAFKCNQKDEFDFDIVYNYKHQIWYPINEKNESEKARKTIHPLIIALSLIQYQIKENENSPIKKNIDIFEILNSITSNWKE